MLLSTLAMSNLALRHSTIQPGHVIGPSGEPGRIEVVTELTGADPGTIALASGETFDLRAIVYDSGDDTVLTGLTITWSSLDTGVVTVDANGVVSYVGNGTTSIRASVTSGGGAPVQDLVAVTTTGPAAVNSVTLTPTTMNLTLGAGTADFTAQPLDASGNALAGRTVTALSSNTSIATVSVSGYAITVTQVAAGTCTVTATCETIDSPARTVTVAATGVDPEFPNRPAGFTTLLTSRDWTADTEDGWTAKSGGTFRNDGTDAPISPPNVFRQTQSLGAAGSSWGTTVKDIADVTAVYLSVHIRLSSTFDGHVTRTNKLGPWLQIDGGSQIFLNGYARDNETVRAELYFQGIVPSLGGNDASGHRRIRSTTGFSQIALVRGQWHQVEVFCQLNTFNAADGIARLYVDGVQCVDATDCAFIGSGTQVPGSASSKFTHVKWNGIWGGGGDSCSTATYVEVDRLDVYGD